MCISILWAFISQEPDSQWEHSGSSASHTLLLSLAYILQNVCACSYPVRSCIWEKYNLHLCHHFNNLSTIFTFQVLNTLKGTPRGDYTILNYTNNNHANPIIELYLGSNCRLWTQKVLHLSCTLLLTCAHRKPSGSFIISWRCRLFQITPCLLLQQTHK